MSLLNEAGEFQKAWDECQNLPPEALDFDQVQILRASIAYQVGLLDETEETLRLEYVSVREGEVILIDLWVELLRKRISVETGRSPDEISRKEIETAYPPPLTIDFRSAG